MTFDSWKGPVNIPHLGRGVGRLWAVHMVFREGKGEQSSATEYKGGLHTILPNRLMLSFD